MKRTRRRVLIVTGWYPSPETGYSGIFVRDQAQVIARQHDVAVLAVSMLPVGLRSGTLWRRVEGMAVTDDGPVRVIRCRQRVLWEDFAGIGSSLGVRMARWFAPDVEREWGRPDLIHAHVSAPAGWIASALGDRFDAPVVLTEHTGPFDVLLRSPVTRRRTEIALRSSARVLGVSDALRRQILARFPGLDVSVLGNVVRTDLFVPPASPNPSSRIRMFTLASLVREKGIFALLEAIERLPAAIRGRIDLRIGGSGPAREGLEAYARRPALADRCAFLGGLEREAAIREMQACDLFVLASEAETFGIVLGEAMACGKPIIATRCGGPQEFVTDEVGCLIEPSDPDALSRAIESFVSAPEEKFSASRAREIIEARFGPDAFLANLTSVYDSLFASAPNVASSTLRTNSR